MLKRTGQALTIPLLVVGSTVAGVVPPSPVVENPSSDRPGPDLSRSGSAGDAQIAGAGDSPATTSDESTSQSGQLTATAAVVMGGTPSGVAEIASIPTSYTVAAGDTVSGISARFGLPTASVLALNGLDVSSVIYPGQVLSLSGAAASPAPDTSPAGTSHTVLTGETVSRIAQRYGVDTQSILVANSLVSDSIIYPGQLLAIPTTAPARPAVPVRPPVADRPPNLTAEMEVNARIIVDTGRSIGVSDRGIVIALATAMQESSLRNVTFGHLDSRGLFQQRPSYGWGTEAQVLDPIRSTLAFFGGSTNPNPGVTRGLLDIPGWENLSVAAAAQAVQISALPDAYAKWEQPATEWFTFLASSPR